MKVLLTFLLVLKLSRAVPLSSFYKFGPQTHDRRLVSTDEGATDELTLQKPIVFYGETYFSVFVNTNGLISFLTEIPYFFNAEFPLDYPTIAPFYSDIDLSATGNVWYRETQDPSSLTQATTEVRDNFFSAHDFRAESVFLVTWDSVGSYKKRTNKLNTFQLAVITGLSDSYVVFKYATGGIQWLRGDGKTHGLLDAIAQAGFVAEDGRYYTLRGSGTDQVRNLDRWSNTHLPGQFVFRVGRIRPGENVQEPDTFLNLAKTGQAMSCATDGTTCHSKATCIDYTQGFCCQCQEDYQGNGINCLKKDTPIRVTGKVSGNINGIDIEDADLHSYVLSSEGRTYTAVSKIPKEVGYDLQSLTAIGEGIAWLFAVPHSGVRNGFTMTGGKLNRTVEINFPQSGHKAFVEQIFLGVDVFNNVAVQTKISGYVPSVPDNAELEVSSFKEEFTLVKPGQLRARSQRQFKLKGQVLSTPFSIETFINFEGCQYEPLDSNMDVFRLKVAENIFIRFDIAENIVRYSFSSKIGSLEEEDPCIKGREECGEHSECIVDGDEFRCLCEQGYDYHFEPVLSVHLCLDIDECNDQTARNHCNRNAQCTNTQGSYTCRCNPGYTGNGFYCEPEVNCATIGCDPNASCSMVGDQPQCECKSGYKGDGFFCTPDFGHESCHIKKDCSPYAVCAPHAGGYSCRCLHGYEGDGYVCVEDYSGQTYENYPSAGVRDPYENNRGQYGTVQDPFGTSYDRQDSFDTSDSYDPSLRRPVYPEETPVNRPYDPLIHGPVNTPSTPSEEGEGTPPECILGVCYCPETLLFNQRTKLCETPMVERKPDVIPRGPEPICGDANCTCPDGYIYDGILHNCLSIDDVLNAPFAICYENECLCPTGFVLKPGTPVGDEKCIPAQQLGYDYSKKGHVDKLSCDQLNTCHIYADCVYDDAMMKSVCVCREGYMGDGNLCTPKDECSNPNDCPAHAQCVFESPRYVCKCEEGYQRDGLFCTKEREPGCDVMRNCDRNARCEYHAHIDEFRCVCNEHFTGDGLYCTPMEVGCHIINNCGENAECAYDYDKQDYACKCREGFSGDGSICIEKQTCETDPTMCHELATCYYGVCTCSPPLQGDGVDECLDPRAHESELLLINQGLSVLRMDIHGRDGYGFPIHVDPFMTAVGADVDCFKGRYYWTDVGSKSIRSSKYDGTERRPLTTQGSIGSPEDVAIDWVSGNIYWTDTENDVVSVAEIKTGMKKNVITDKLVNPRGIAVHPGKGSLYWSDWNRVHPKIETSFMDGTQRTILVDTDVALPNSLVFDFLADNLCWADAGTHKIECIGPYGRRVIVEDSKYPFGLTLFERTFFYTDWKDGKIHEVDIRTRSEEAPRNPPPGGSGKLYGIAAVPKECPNVSNRCQNQRGGCPDTHLCLPNGLQHGSITCACPDGQENGCRDFRV